MQTLSEQIIEAGLADRVLRDSQLERLVPGTPQRRYNLVNRALKSGELVRLRRGLYLLDDRFRASPPHPFALAQALVPGSYVSFETALSHHGWIPESVTITASVTPGRKSLHHPSAYGEFEFRPLAIADGQFLQLIGRETYAGQVFLVAHPLRALMDLVCLRKLSWRGLEWITESLRIDEENLRSSEPGKFRLLESVYTQKRVKQFASQLRRDISGD